MTLNHYVELFFWLAVFLFSCFIVGKIYLKSQ